MANLEHHTNGLAIHGARVEGQMTTAFGSGGLQGAQGVVASIDGMPLTDADKSVLKLNAGAVMNALSSGNPAAKPANSGSLDSMLAVSGKPGPDGQPMLPSISDLTGIRDTAIRNGDPTTAYRAGQELIAGHYNRATQGMSPSQIDAAHGIGQPVPAPAVGQQNFNDANKAMNLTPQEQALYQRHLTNLTGPGGVDNANGSRSTLFQSSVEVNGKTYNIPTVWDGKILSPQDALARPKAEGIEKFPAYANEAQAENRYQQMHGYMEKDTSAYFQSRNGAPSAFGAQPGIAGDLSSQSTYANKGQPIQPIGFIVHHTAGPAGETPQDVINTLNQRGLCAQYIMDRDGKIYSGLPEGTRGAQIQNANNGSGLNNSNSLGMEIIAKDAGDVTPQQKQAAAAFITAKAAQYGFPVSSVYGHGEVNQGHKEPDEGLAVAQMGRGGSRGTGFPAAATALSGRGSPGNPAMVSQIRAGATSAGVDPNLMEGIYHGE